MALLYESPTLNLEKDTGLFISKKEAALELCERKLRDLFYLAKAKAIWIMIFDNPGKDRVKIKKDNRRNWVVIDGKVSVLTPSALRILSRFLKSGKAVYVQVMLEQK